jgi:hypothetical protein
MLFGALLPCVVGAATMTAVGRAAGAIVEEIRRQFREIPGLLEGKEGVEPQPKVIVDIATKAAIKEMILPGAVAVLAPAGGGLHRGPRGPRGRARGRAGRGRDALAGDGQRRAAPGTTPRSSSRRAASPATRRAPTRTRPRSWATPSGDPFKDTSGPGIAILIKVMSVVSLLIAPLIAAEPGSPVLVPSASARARSRPWWRAAPGRSSSRALRRQRLPRALLRARRHQALGLPDGGVVPHAAGRPGARDRRRCSPRPLGGDGLHPAAEPHLRSHHRRPAGVLPLRAALRPPLRRAAPPRPAHLPRRRPPHHPAAHPQPGALHGVGHPPRVHPQAARGLPHLARDPAAPTLWIDTSKMPIPSDLVARAAALDAVMHSLEPETRRALFGRRLPRRARAHAGDAGGVHRAVETAGAAVAVAGLEVDALAAAEGARAEGGARAAAAGAVGAHAPARAGVAAAAAVAVAALEVDALAAAHRRARGAHAATRRAHAAAGADHAAPAAVGVAALEVDADAVAARRARRAGAAARGAGRSARAGDAAGAAVGCCRSAG